MQHPEADGLFDRPVKTFASHTVELIRMKQYDQLEKCFLLVEKILESREEELKALIEDHFIPFITNHLEHCAWRDSVLGLFPRAMKRSYRMNGVRSATYEGVLVNEYREFLIHLN